MTANDFRRLALAMDGAIEGAHMDHPDFRANGRIFATLHADHKQGMVKVTPDQQRELIASHPDVFSPASGAWGRQGCTMVRLAAVDADTLGIAMTQAWQNSALAPARRKQPSRQRRKT